MVQLLVNFILRLKMYHLCLHRGFLGPPVLKGCCFVLDPFKFMDETYDYSTLSEDSDTGNFCGSCDEVSMFTEFKFLLNCVLEP